ncbi:GNAT family N-acetyltransferase [Arthrobacter pascens]|uniref:GNAT family N-acetyltransferase n=1 Tax=Arthrobacter pascens TaxID=1677 RepID=UPI00196B4D80|nr:GNAT family N-acetyltransferase [Arthrobacter pascens]MBN3496879.1 acetyltransferase [Arthrobacter pascens]
MNGLKWNRNLLLEDHALRLATPADAEGLATLMAEPDVEQWWHQAWAADRWAEYVAGLLRDPDSLALTLVAGERVTGYVEVYRVAADDLGRHIEHTQTDLGMHLALGELSRGRGLGARVIRGVLESAPEVLAGCGRLVAEPDFLNKRSHRAFGDAGFQSVGTVQLPDKTALLMAAEPAPPPRDTESSQDAKEACREGAQL